MRRVAPATSFSVSIAPSRSWPANHQGAGRALSCSRSTVSIAPSRSWPANHVTGSNAGIILNPGEVSIAPSRSWPANHYQLLSPTQRDCRFNRAIAKLASEPSSPSVLDGSPQSFNRAIAKLASEPNGDAQFNGLRTYKLFQSRHREAGQRTRLLEFR